jgi:pimeloyl-ACP methyl ester carboxylesterase
MPAVARRLIRTNGIRLHCLLAGDGPLVVLLHGFPECAESWRHQIPVLATRFRVVAPDLRGYDLSDKPRAVAAYDLRELAADVQGLVEALGVPSARLVGHDWGGGVAWATAMLQPSVVERLALVNMPHPVRFQEEIRRNVRQLLKSWYVFAFQIPGLPEWFLERRGGRGVTDALRGAFVRPEAFTADYVETLRTAATRPGGMRGPVNYYRAALRSRPDVGHWPRVRVPTVMIWGDRDIALRPELADRTEALIDAPFRLHRIPEAGHFVHQEYPDRVNRILMEFLAAPEA